MKDKKQVEQEFRQELQVLLDKYGAEIEAEDHYPGYSECGEDIYMEVTIPSLYDENHNCIREWTEINLGQRIYAKEPGVKK